MGKIRPDALFSDLARGMKPSPIRELMPYIKKPGMISFAGGNPDPNIFPIDKFAEGASVLRKDGANVLQYGPTEGYEPLRNFVANWMAPRMGRVTELDEILITSGSQQGMDLLCAALINPGDGIIIEEHTYPGAIHTMRNRGAAFLPAPCDSDGIKVDLLPGIIENFQKSGGTVKFIYSIVNFQNPAGCTLSTERRKKMLQIAREYDLIIFEDDPYGHLRYDGNHKPTVFSMDEDERVIYACSFSKILAPGARVAWVVGHRDIIRKMVMVKQGADLCTSVAAQALVAQYCLDGHLDGFLPRIVGHYRNKRDGMAAAFRKYLPSSVEYDVPEGGFFFWLRLPGVDTGKLFEKAVARGVAFVQGRAFYVNDGGEDSLRACFTFAKEDELEEGARRLGDAIADLI